MSEKSKAALISVFSNTLLVCIKLFVGVLTRSVSITAEAIHSGVDLLASGIALYAVKESDKPADKFHNFGHGKVENVAGTVEAVLIFGAAFYIIYESVNKLLYAHYIVSDTTLGIVVMSVSSICNFFVSRYLKRVSVRTDSVALEADSIHLSADVYTSIGVLIGLILIKVTGIVWLDPIVAIVVALFIIKSAWSLTSSAFAPILDTCLPEEDILVIKNVLETYSNTYIEFHELRTRKSGKTRYIDMHLVVSQDMSVKDSHSLGHQIIKDIQEKLLGSSVLVHIEPCLGICPQCAIPCKEKK